MPTGSKHDRILATLESEILGGKYAPGRAAFPSERALASRFKAARLTVRMVVQELKRFGYLSQRQGSGTFVTRKGANRKIGLVIPDMRQTKKCADTVLFAIGMRRSLCYNAIRNERKMCL